MLGVMGYMLIIYLLRIFLYYGGGLGGEGILLVARHTD
jgi:hypothetical protein